MIPTTALESIPPLRKAPSGTSEISRRPTASSRRERTSAAASRSERSTCAAPSIPATGGRQ